MTTAAQPKATSRVFAYGSDMVAGETCPARCAGVDPCEVEAAEFDDAVRAKTGRSEGIVKEDVARRIWLDLIERGGNRFIRARRRQVARALGWST